MTCQTLYFLSIPGLRMKDLAHLPTLRAWAGRGAAAELKPTFPCVTSPVQASMITGLPPRVHGVIANGFYFRDRRAVEFWVAPHEIVKGEAVWDALQRKNRAITSAVWHAQNIKGAGADWICTPSPIHEPDGTTKLWCYSKPDGLYESLLPELGHFPLQHYWGPLAGIASTRWILDGAVWLARRHRPRFQWIYIPHLDYAAQKFGPDSPAALAALGELEAELARFAGAVAELPHAEGTGFLVAGEYALTGVSGVLYPNRVLREAGLLAVRESGGREFLDLERSRAFAMVDHQLAHVFVRNAADVPRAAAFFRGQVGIADVLAGEERARLGIDHERSAEVVLVSRDDHWFAYYWWMDDALAPPFAHTVDIHAKPGYDPVELFFSPVIKGIPTDATLVKGSHGAPAAESHHRAALIASHPPKAFRADDVYRDTDLKAMTLAMLGE